MSAPTIAFAYLTYARDYIYVVCRVDSGYTPLKLVALGSANNGWTLLKNGGVASLTGTVASPRPNCVALQLDSPGAVTDVFTLAYSPTTGEIIDQLTQEIVAYPATTVLDCLPIIDLIASDIVSRLEEITTANGYLFDLTVVDDLKDTQRIREGLTTVSYDDPVSEDSPPLGHEQFTANFHIETSTAISSASDRPLTSKEYQIEAEIMKRLQVDYGRNGLAVDTIPLSPARTDLGIGGWGGVQVNVMVRYRTLYGNRFEQ